MDTPRYFLTPSGQSWRLDRSITRDNWLTWRQALPVVDTSCLTVRYKRLDATVCRNITKLAAGLQALLEDTGGRGLDDNPWTIHRWWRYRDGEPFSAGAACEFSAQSLDPAALIEHAPGHGLHIEMLFAPMLVCRLLRPQPLEPSPEKESSSNSPTRS